MTDREIMQQALEALEEACQIVGAAWAWRDEKGKPSITTLRERLAQPEQEPVACQYAKDVAMPEYRCAGKCQYAQPKQEPVALEAAPLSDYSKADGDFHKWWYSHMQNDLMQPPLNEVGYRVARYIWDAALRERLAQTEQEPQRQWRGLTDEDIAEIAEKLGLADVAWVDLMQAIERRLKKRNT